MAIEPLDRGSGHWEIRGPRAVAHLTEHSDGTWTVEEDEQHQKFPDRGSAFDFAREITGEF